MTSQWTYTITHYDESDSWSPTTLTSSDVDSIPLFTDQGSGEINRCIIRLNALNGKFLLDTVDTQPYLDQFDKIRLVVTDGLDNTYNRVFEITEIVPSEDAGQGTICQVECLGNEWYLQHLNYSKPHWFKNAFSVGQSAGDVYNSNIGTKQPTLLYHDKPYNTTLGTLNGVPSKLGNNLPNFNVNIYDYDTSEKPIYDVLLDLIDRQAASVDVGGILDFFELGFDTSGTDLHKIHMRLFSSGIDPKQSTSGLEPVTIDASSGGTTVNINLDESEGGISAQSATRVLTWGDMGALPTDYAKYNAGEIDFVFRPEWSSNSINYLVSAKIRYKGNHFKCLIAHKSNSGNFPPSTAVSSATWQSITFMNQVANTYSYSKWTEELVESWKAMGSNYAGSGTYGQGIWDSNLVINSTDPENASKGFKRTWAHAATNLAPNFYFYDDPLGSRNATAPRGYRILNGTTGTGAGTPWFNGTDLKTGSPYAYSILSVDEDGGTYNVFLDPRTLGDKIQCAVLNEGKVYEWNTATNRWVDKSADLVKNDCFHPFTSYTNVNGTAAAPESFQEGRKIDQETLHFTSGKGYNSALQMTNTYNTITTLGAAANYYKAFAGVCLGFPFPFHSKDNYPASTVRVGDKYYPATIDPRNMNFTSTNLNGFNETDSEDLGSIESIGFEALVQYNLGNTTNKDANALLVANIPIRVTVYDTEDNVFVSDQIIPFRNNWTTMVFPINDFKPYKAHIPLSRTKDWLNILHPKDLEPTGVFNWRNLKLMSIQIQSFYDEFGRYSPLRAVDPDNWLLNPQSVYPLFGATVTIKIDGFRFNKRNLAMTAKDTTRNIEAPFGQRNDIISYNQLKKDAESQLEIEQFQHKEFVVGTQGTFDIRFGDSFYYKNPRLVNDADKPITPTTFVPNTIKLVAKKIEYSIIKSNKGKGGLLRKIHGVKRFY